MKTLECAKHSRLSDSLKRQCWELYAPRMAELEVRSPYRQLLSQAEFTFACKETSFHKYVASSEGQVVGFALVATDIKSVPWLNSAYFTGSSDPDLTKAWYLVGIVADTSAGVGGRLLRYTVEDFVVAYQAAISSAFTYDFSLVNHPLFGNLGVHLGKRYSLPGRLLDRMQFVVCCAE
jgi:hypothetical protein